MLIDIETLFNNVLILLLMLIPGAIMSRILKGDRLFSAGISKLVLYIASPAMIIAPFISSYKGEMLEGIVWTFLFSFFSHLLFYFVAHLILGEEKMKRTLRFAVVFSNAGYMGIPLIESLLGAEATIYATAYNVTFNIFLWTLGCFIYTRDKKFMRPKKILTTPVIIACFIGLLLFFTPASDYVPTVAVQAVNMLKSLVAPLSMLVVGYQAATADYKKIFANGRMWLATALRLIACPAAIFAVMKLAAALGIYQSATVATVVLIASATPAATSTSMFAEMFDGDAPLSGVAVPLTTVLSLITMPAVALLLKLY